MRPRTATIAIVMLLAAGVLAAPAAAKQPDGKGKPPQADIVDVTLQVVGAEGLATTCDDADGVAGSLRMERTQNGLTSIDGIAPLLSLHMADIAWSRQYPDPASGLGFAECHGGTVNGSPGEWEGYLSFGLDAAGNPTDIIWHFDYYVSSTLVQRGKKTRETPYIREHFTLSGPLTWDPATSTATGTLQIAYYFNDYVNGDQVLYEPFPGSPRHMAFTMNVETVG